MSLPDSPLRIGLISRYYPPDPGGGLALYTRQIARELVRQGHEVIVISATEQDNPRVERDQGVLVNRIPQLKMYKRSITGGTCLWNSLQIAGTLGQIHQERPFSIVQCPATFFESFMYGHFERFSLQIPLVVKFHENKETYERIEGRFKLLKAGRRKWFKYFLRQVAKDADYWLGVSKHALDGSLEYLNLTQFPCPRSVSESPIDVQALRPLTSIPPGYFESFGLSSESRFLFYSGRLIYEKGLHLLVEAFLSKIASRFPDLCLAIAGEFDYRQADYEQRIRNQIQGHPAASRIFFLGRIPYEMMPAWYSACDLFVAPSLCEPFGRVFIEAMACEAPTMGFNKGGPTEIICHGEDGFLVNEINAESLGESICLLLENPNLLLGLRQKGREKVSRCFSQEKIVSDLVVLYRDLIEQRQQVFCS